MAGHIAGKVGYMPSVFIKIIIQISIVATFGLVKEPTINEKLVLQIGTKTCDAKLINISDDMFFTLELIKPICISDNQHIIICHNIDNILRIIGEGTISYTYNTDPLIK